MTVQQTGLPFSEDAESACVEARVEFEAALRAQAAQVATQLRAPMVGREYVEVARSHLYAAAHFRRRDGFTAVGGVLLGVAGSGWIGVLSSDDNDLLLSLGSAGCGIVGAALLGLGLGVRRPRR